MIFVSGTTLTQEIVWLIRNNGDVEKANSIKTAERVPFVEFSQANGFQKFFQLPRPRHMKTHLPYRHLPIGVREGNVKVVYVMRNPKDTLVSYYHFYRMSGGLGKFQGSWDDFFAVFLEAGGKLHYGNPMDHMKGFWEHRNDANVHITIYEEILKDPGTIIKGIAKFLDVDLSTEAVEAIIKATAFDTMQKNPMTNMTGYPGDAMDHSISSFMRKGVVGDWKNYFSDEQNQVIDDMYKEKLSGSGLIFTYE